MGRLIDADALKNEIADQMKSVQTDTSWATYMTAFVVEAMVHLINRQPTAYDIEKVVAELEEEKEVVKEYDKYYHAVRIENAIDIVKRGGVE